MNSKRVRGIGRRVGTVLLGIVLGVLTAQAGLAIEPITPVSEAGQYAFSLEVDRHQRTMETKLRQGTNLYAGRPDFTSTRVFLRGDYAVLNNATLFVRLGTADMDGGNFTLANLEGKTGFAWGMGFSTDFKNEFLIPGVRWGGSVFYTGYKSDLNSGDLDVSEYGGSLRIWKAFSPFIVYTGPRLTVTDVDISTTASGLNATGEASEDEQFSWAFGVRYNLMENIALNLEGEVIGQKSVGMSLVYRFGDPVGPTAPPVASGRRDHPAPLPWAPRPGEEELEPASDSSVPPPPGLFAPPPIPDMRPQPQLAPPAAPAVRQTATRSQTASAQNQQSGTVIQTIDAAGVRAEANEAYGNGNYRDAAELYALLLTAEPNNFQAAYNRAACLYRLSEWREAESAYRQAAQINPRDVETKLYLGFSRFRQGDRAGAAEAWRQVLELEPNNARAKSNLAAIGR